MVFLMLTNQAGLYMKHGANLIDCFWHEKRKSLCFVFEKEKTNDLWKLWEKHELI